MASKKMSSKARPPPPLIKGYLPVRLKLPSGEETFFYVKEHQMAKSSTGSSAADKKKKKTDTLFVVNSPIVPPVRTKTLLQSIFGRYGDVSRVTVVENPRSQRHQQQQQLLHATSLSWTNKFAPPNFLPPVVDSAGGGNFAHVVFSSHHEMKQVLRTVTTIMVADEEDEEELSGIALDKNELQNLVASEDKDDDADDKAALLFTKKKSRVLIVAERYRRACRRLSSSRSALMEECNAVMREFEHAEESERLAREAAANEPDENGFITVTYNTNSATTTTAPQLRSKRQKLDEDAASHRRKGGQKRKRKKKHHGASELSDFYRFQTKVERKKTLQELRQSFEEDLVKLRKMKEERNCLPF